MTPENITGCIFTVGGLLLISEVVILFGSSLRRSAQLRESSRSQITPEENYYLEKLANKDASPNEEQKKTKPKINQAQILAESGLDIAYHEDVLRQQEKLDEQTDRDFLLLYNLARKDKRRVLK